MAYSPPSLPPWAKRREDPNPPDGWQEMPMVAVTDIRFSNVDKKSYASEKPVRLCNYMDVYNKEYVRGDEDFMHATASEGEIARFAVKAGDVIITKDSETPDDIGVPAVVLDAPDDLLCGYHLALIRPRSDQVDPVFLAKQLAHHRISRYYARLANGLTRYGLTNAVVENTPIWLPEPDEQRLAAGILRGIDDAIAKTEALIAKLKAVKQGLLHDLLTRGLDDNGELRDPEKHPEQFKDSPVGLIPKQWEVAFFKEYADVLGGKRLPSGHAYTDRETGLYYLRVIDFYERVLDFREMMKIEDRTFDVLSRYEIRDGELFISIAGSLGYAGVYRPPKGTRTILTENAARIVPNSHVRPDFLSLEINGPLVQAQIRQQKGISSGVPKLALFRIQNLRIVVPPLNEQVHIEDAITTYNRHIEAEGAYLLKLKAIKKGLMQDLLTGRVRVKG